MFMGFVNNATSFLAIFPVVGDNNEPVVAASTYVVYGPLGDVMPNSSGSAISIVQGVYKAAIPVSTANLYEVGKFYYLMVSYPNAGHNNLHSFTFGVI